MKAIRIMQRVILALFILTLLAFCGLRIYRQVTVAVTPPVITCSSASIDASVTAGAEARPCSRASWPPTSGTGI